jgi:hypothetical protein
MINLEDQLIHRLDESKAMIEEIQAYFDEEGGFKEVVKDILGLTVDIIWWVGSLLIGLTAYLTNRGIEAVMSLVDNGSLPENVSLLETKATPSKDPQESFEEDIKRVFSDPGIDDHGLDDHDRKEAERYLEM